jgi:hypothetical protein
MSADKSADSNGGFEMPVAGREHALLKPFEGKFRATVKIYMGAPEPQVSTGTMFNTFQLGGLYLHQDYQGDAPPQPHLAFIGRGYWGFNFGSQLYEGFWIDNASSMMQTESGTVDSTGKSWTMTSEFTNPRDGSTIKKRTEIKVKDADHHSMDSFMTAADGNEFRTMTIDYKRSYEPQ